MRRLCVEVKRLLMAASYLLYRHDRGIDLPANSWHESKYVRLQHCSNNLKKTLSCFNMAVAPCINRDPCRNGGFVLHRVLNSVQSNIFGISWNLTASQVLSPNAVADLAKALMAE